MLSATEAYIFYDVIANAVAWLLYELVGGGQDGHSTAKEEYGAVETLQSHFWYAACFR